MDSHPSSHLAFTTEQLKHLKKSFDQYNIYPPLSEKNRLVEKLNVSYQQINSWFDSQRNQCDSENSKTDDEKSDNGDSEPEEIFYEEINDFRELKDIVCSLANEETETTLKWIKNWIEKAEKIQEDKVKWYDTVHGIEKIQIFMNQLKLQESKNTREDRVIHDRLICDIRSILWNFKTFLDEFKVDNDPDMIAKDKENNMRAYYKENPSDILYQCTSCSLDFNEKALYYRHLRENHRKIPIEPFSQKILKIWAINNKVKLDDVSDIVKSLRCQLNEALLLLPPTEEKTDVKIPALDSNKDVVEDQQPFWSRPADWAEIEYKSKIILMQTMLDKELDLNEQTWLWLKENAASNHKNEFLILPIPSKWIAPMNQPSIIRLLSFLKFVPPNESVPHWIIPNTMTSEFLGAKSRFISEIIDEEVDFDSLTNVNFQFVGFVPQIKKLIEINQCKCCKCYNKSLIQHLKKSKNCSQDYSDEDMKNLKEQVKSKQLANKREKMKSNYQSNKKDILSKRKIHYQGQKNNISQQKTVYYQKNKEKIHFKNAEYYKKNKEEIIQKEREKTAVKKIEKADERASKIQHAKDMVPVICAQYKKSNEERYRGYNMKNRNSIEEDFGKVFEKFKLKSSPEIRKKLEDLESEIKSTYDTYENKIDQVLKSLEDVTDDKDQVVEKFEKFGQTKWQKNVWHDLKLKFDLALKELFGDEFIFCCGCTCSKCKSSKRSPVTVTKSTIGTNENYVMKRKPVKLSMADLEEGKEDEDQEFKCGYSSTPTKKILPKRKCTKNVVFESDSDLE